MAVRYMIVNEKAKDREIAAEVKQEEQILLTTSESALKDQIAALAKMTEFAPDMRLKLIEALVAQ